MPPLESLAGTFAGLQRTWIPGIKMSRRGGPWRGSAMHCWKRAPWCHFQKSKRLFYVAALTADIFQKIMSESGYSPPMPSLRQNFLSCSGVLFSLIFSRSTPASVPCCPIESSVTFCRTYNQQMSKRHPTRSIRTYHSICVLPDGLCG